MKHTKHILLMAAMLLGILSVSAEVVQIDGIWYDVVKKAKQAEVVSNPDGTTKYSGNITIPSIVEYDGVECSVTSIGERAFFGCSSLTAITIPESVTSIGEDAFSGCSSLTAITLPEGVTSIGWYAFNNCSSLTAINIPESVTSIGDCAFWHCSSLTSITLPLSVTSIGHSAFNGCSSLTAINISENVGYINEYAFCNCSSLTAINIPASVWTIGEYAFYNCSSLTDITFTENSQLTNINYYAFSGCISLTAITLPKSVRYIYDYAFSGCSSLTSITIPEDVRHIADYAFANCADLLDVYCYAEQVPSTDESTFEKSYPEYMTLHVPASALESYKTTAPWSSFGTIVALGASITDITLSQSSATLYEGEALTLSISVTPSNADMNLISWSSSNPNVATVDAEGKVAAVSTGTATITVTANDGSGVSASCEVTVVEATSYSLTFMVDGEVFQTETSETPIEVVFPEAPEKEGHSFVRWELGSSDASLTDIDIANNADAMLYSNAPCTNTQYGDQFTSWDVLFDDDYNTFFHSEYSEGVDSEDGEHHYLRVDMGEGNAVSQFTFSYAMRGDQFPYHTPTEIIVEGSNEADGEYEVIAVLTDLATPPYDIDYTSDVLGNGKAYRYIRYRVTRTRQNSLICGHPYFYISEFGMKEAQDCYNAVFYGVYAPNKYKVYYYAGEELLGYEEVTYGDNMPNMGYFPALDTEEFLGWISETGDTYETMPAHDVIYVANIRTYEKCATPTMEYADGRVTFSCETEGVEFRTQVIDDKRLIYRTDSDGFEFVPTYTFTTRATKEDCIDSDEVSITICWINCTGEHESDDEDTGIISVPSQPIIIRCVNGMVTLTGLADGTEVMIYDLAGNKVGTAIAVNGTAIISTGLENGSTAIIKIAERSVKVVIK